MAEKKKYPSDVQDQYMVRFPAGMRDRIRLLAEGAGRSMNAEIVHRLQRTLDDDLNEATERTFKLPGDDNVQAEPRELQGSLDRLFRELENIKGEISRIAKTDDGEIEIEIETPMTTMDLVPLDQDEKKS